MSTPASQPLDQAKLHEFVMRAVGEMGAAMNAALIVIGDKLGLYKAMSGAGPMTSARRIGCGSSRRNTKSCWPSPDREGPMTPTVEG